MGCFFFLEGKEEEEFASLLPKTHKETETTGTCRNQLVLLQEKK